MWNVISRDTHPSLQVGFYLPHLCLFYSGISSHQTSRPQWQLEFERRGNFIGSPRSAHQGLIEWMCSSENCLTAKPGRGCLLSLDFFLFWIANRRVESSDNIHTLSEIFFTSHCKERETHSSAKLNTVAATCCGLHTRSSNGSPAGRFAAFVSHHSITHIKYCWFNK